MVQDIKDKKLFDNARSAKLQNTLERITRRTLKEGHERLRGIMFAAPKVKATVKRMDGILKRKPKEAFDKWRKYVQAVNNKEIYDGMRSQQLLNCLERIPKRKMRDATQRIVGEGDKVKGAIKKIFSTLQRMPKTAIEQWRKYIIACNNKDFFDNLRSARLLNCLSRIPIRRTRDASQRILGGGSKIKGALQTLVAGLKNIPRKSLRRWKQTVQDIKDKKLYDNARSAKLQVVLERIPKRKTRDCVQRIVGEGSKVKGAIKKIFMTLQKMPKTAIDQWKKYVIACNNRDFFDNLRSAKLLNVLNRIPIRRTRDATQRILGGGDKIKGQLQNLINGLKSVPKNALRKWAKTVQDIKDRKLYDNVRSYRLLMTLQRIQRRTLKETHERVRGTAFLAPQLKSIFKQMDQVLKRKPKEAFDRWRKYVQAVNNKEIFDGIRSQKLKNCLEKIPLRRLRDTTQRIAGDGDKVKGAIKKIFSTLQRMPKTAIEQWKKYVVACNNKDFFDNLRSAKLLNCLNRIPIRVSRDATQRILGDGSKVLGALKSLVAKANKIPRTALVKWRSYVELCKQNGILDNVRSHKLLLVMEHITRRTLREAGERVLDKVFGAPKVKEALKKFEQVLRRRPKVAYDIWTRYVAAVRDRTLLDGIRTQKLQIALTNIPRRTTRDSFQRVFGEGDKVRGALKSIVNAFGKLTKRSVEQWKAYVFLCRSNRVLDNLRSEKLKFALSRLHLRTLKDSHERIVGEGSKVRGALRRLVLAGQKLPKQSFETWKKFVHLCKTNQVFDLVKSHKLLIAMSRIALGTLRDANLRITGEGDKVKGALRRIVIQLNKNTRVAYNSWRDFVLQVRNHTVFENSRAQKLLHALQRVPRRTMKGANERMLGEGNQALGALRRLAITSQKLPKIAVEKWRKFVSECKKHVIIDNVRTLNLKDRMSLIPVKLFKTIFERIVKGEKQCKEKLKTLAKIHNKKPLRATQGWKTNVEVDKVMKPLVANRLRYALSRLPLRNLRKSFEMMFHKDQSHSALRRLFIIYNNATKRGFANWKEYMMKCRRGDVFDMMRAQKLSAFMNRIPSRVMRGSMMRIFGDGSRALGMLRLLATKALLRPREALKNWSDYVNKCKRGELFDSMRSAQLLSAMNRISTRTMRQAAFSIISVQDKIKSMFRILAVDAKESAKIAWVRWMQYTAGVKRGELLDAVKTQKLQKSLAGVPTRTMRDAFERVIGDGSRVKGALRRLEIACSKVRDSAFFIWRDFMIKRRARESLRELKAQQLRSNVKAIPVRTLKDAIDRILGDGAKVAGCLRRLAIFVKNQQRESFRRWKEKLMSGKTGDLTKGNKIRHVLEAVAKRTLKVGFNKIMGDLRARRGAARMCRNLFNQQRSVMERLKDRVNKLQMIKKVNSAYLLMKMLKLKCDMMIKGRFRMWKNMEALRRMRLMRKAMMHMFFFASINFENAFWKWKYVLTIKGMDLNPKHSLMHKRLSQVAHNYQVRLKQFALFKVCLYFRSNPQLTQQSRKSIQFAVSSLVKATREEGPSSPTLERKPESKMQVSVRGSVSTDAAGKLSKEELIGVNQLGGAEVIALQMRNLRTRNVAISFANIVLFSKQIGVFDDERSRLIEQINELRYDKHSLLEDNTALRHHNEALIDNLEKTNMNFQSLSLHLDQMRLGRMVRVISKMIELPMLEALIMVKHHVGVS